MLFDNRAIQQGESFVSNGDVVLTQATSRNATVEVLDDDGPYTVLLHRSDSLVRAGCECDDLYCRHMWAALVITDNPGCIMQLRGALHARGSATRVQHLAEYLADGLPGV